MIKAAMNIGTRRGPDTEGRPSDRELREQALCREYVRNEIRFEHPDGTPDDEAWFKALKMEGES